MESWRPVLYTFDSPIHPVFRVKGSGITTSLLITSFTLYSSMIHLSLCSSSRFTSTLSHQAEKAFSEFFPLRKECLSFKVKSAKLENCLLACGRHCVYKRNSFSFRGKIFNKTFLIRPIRIDFKFNIFIVTKLTFLHLWEFCSANYHLKSSKKSHMK